MMMNLLICGSNFHTEEQDDELFPMSANSSPSSTPRRSTRLFCKNNNSRDKNPYATRGLEKFSALLADLEEKRQKIYAENGTDQDISFVRFVYKNSNDLVPVVVKLKDNNNNKSKNTKNKKVLIKTKSCITCTNANKEETKDTRQSQTPSDQIQSQDKFAIETSVAEKETVIKRSHRKIFSWRGVKWDRLRKPSYYLPVVVLIILLLLTVFGRSVAILCTSIGWYVVPALKGNASARKRTSATKILKKDYVKRLSDKRMVSEGVVSSPRAHNNKST